MDQLIDPDVAVVDVKETAERLARRFATRAAAHDETDGFVEENYVDLKHAGLIRAGVPRELGGGGASLRELCEMLRVIAGACGSTGLALSMHTHQVAIPAWRWRQSRRRAPYGRTAFAPCRG